MPKGAVPEFCKEDKNFRVVKSRLLTGCNLCQVLLLIRVCTAFQQKLHHFDISGPYGTDDREVEGSAAGAGLPGKVIVQNFRCFSPFCKKSPDLIGRAVLAEFDQLVVIDLQWKHEFHFFLSRSSAISRPFAKTR